MRCTCKHPSRSALPRSHSGRRAGAAAALWQCREAHQGTELRLVLDFFQVFVDIFRGVEMRMALVAIDRATSLAESVAESHELHDSLRRQHVCVEAVSSCLWRAGGR